MGMAGTQTKEIRSRLAAGAGALRAAALAVVLLLSATAARGQELEYALEIGPMLGCDFYLGDANTSAFYKGSNVAAGVFARYNLNPRMSVKAKLGYGGISGDARNQEAKFPDMDAKELKFNNKVWDLSATFELGFFGYGTGTGYKGHKRLVPYLQLGLGATMCGDVFTMNLPVGFGIRYKLKERWNIGLDWTMHFSLSDKLDGLEDPLDIKSGFLKNKDSYCFTMIYVAYDLCPKYRKCNNE